MTLGFGTFRDDDGNYQVPQAADQTLPPEHNLYPSTLSAYTPSQQQTLNLPYHTFNKIAHIIFLT